MSSQIFLPVAAMLAPALFCTWFIHQYGVNVLVWDDWEIVPLVTRLSQGTLRLADLWAQHNEHRMFFPNLLFVLVYKTTHLDTVAEMYLNLLTLCAACCALLWLRGRQSAKDLWWDMPVVCMALSLAQSENLLFGFQTAWYLVLLCVVLALCALDRCVVRPAYFVAAIAAGVVGSFSSLQGLLVWPCGLIFMTGGLCTKRQRLFWTFAGIVTAAVYFAGLDLGHAHGPSLAHPGLAIRYFLTAAGSATQARELSGPMQISLGVITCVIALYVVTIWLFRHRKDRDLRISAALIGFGLLFDILLVAGRVGFRSDEAGIGPKYATYNLWLLSGVYLGVRTLAQDEHQPHASLSHRLMLAVVLVLVVAQVGLSDLGGISNGKLTRYARIQAADIVANYRIVPDPLIERFVYPRPRVFRNRAGEAERYRLSLFSSEQSVQAYVRQGIVPGGRLNLVLVPPPALRLYLSENPKVATAWRVLSAVYLYRRDLQARFRPRTPLFVPQLLTWATTTGVTSDSYRVFLAPYAAELRALLAVSSSAGH